MSSRSRSTTRKSTKRSRTMRSQSRRPAYKSTRTLAIAGRNVGLGTSALTVLRTSFFANVVASGTTGIWTGYLKPGSCFDPCGDIAAVQPQMFDQFAQAYSRYQVENYTIRLTVHGISGGGTASTYVVASYPALDNAALTTYQGAASQQYAKTKSGGFQSISAGNAPGAAPVHLYFKFKHASIVGNKIDSYHNGAAVTGDPVAEQFAYQPIFIQCNGNSAGSFMLEVDMFQTVRFTQKKNVVDV